MAHRGAREGGEKPDARTRWEFVLLKGGVLDLTREVKVCVRVPASTSNLGSGFDTLGLAVDLYLTVRAERISSAELEMECGSNYDGARRLVLEAAAPWMAEGHGYRIAVESEVPVGRGLGASAALRVGVTRAVSALCGVELSKEELLERVYALEGHPDNASPAIYGGFTVSGKVQGKVRCERFEVSPELKLVTLIPNFEMPTGEARRLMPQEYSRADAAHSLNRAALVTAAFASGRYENLRGVFDDVLHQPYREKLIPQMSEVIRAGEEAGAMGGFLSGAGSAIICVALEKEEEIARAMNGVMPPAAVRVLRPVNEGLILL